MSEGEYVYNKEFEVGDKVIILDGKGRREYRRIGWDVEMDDYIGATVTLACKWPQDHAWEVFENNWIFSDELMVNLSLGERQDEQEFDQQEFNDSFIKFMGV